MITSAALTLLLCAADPRAQAIANARALVDDFQFDKALSAISETLKQPNVDTASLISLYELESIARATKGDTAGAKDAFARLLIVDPAHVMPNELPPKVRTLFFGAKTVAQREALGFEAEVPTRVGGFIESVSVVVKRSALVPAKNVRFTVSADGAAPVTTVVPVNAEPKVELKVHGAQLTWSAVLLGNNDAVLRSVAREEDAPVVVPKPVEPKPVVVVAAPPAGSAVRPAGVVVGAGGLVAVGIGIALAVQSADARKQLTTATVDGNGVVTGVTQAKAQQLDATARSSALAANVLMIAGGVATAGGLLMVLLAPQEPPPALSLSVGPTGIVASGHF